MNQPSTPKPAADADALITAGLQAHSAGRLGEAEALYAQALKVHPNHPDALNLSGVAAFAQGRTDQAIRLIGQAVRAKPDHVDAYLNLAEALEAAGRVAEAMEACRKALEAKPDFAEAYGRLARLHAQSGMPGMANAYARVALALEPKQVEAICGHALALRRLLQHGAAEAAYRRALEIAPDDVNAIVGLAGLLGEQDAVAEPAALYRRALELQPDMLLALLGLGDILERDGDMTGAVACCERARALAPGNAEVVQRWASSLRDHGDFDAAEAAFHEALKIDPNHAPAVLSLVRMKRFEGSPAQQKQLARQIADAKLPPRHRVQAGFALGEILDKAGDPDGAFARFTEANRLLRSLRESVGEVFDRADLKAQGDLVRDQLGHEYAADTEGWGNPTDAAVFIVGLPRSGTTLVEQICASHSRVHGAGELGALRLASRRIALHNQGRGEHIGDWDVAFARGEADRHAAELARMGAGALRVVDKAPLNLMRLGVVGALFPNARVIRCRRDPRDIAVSNHTMYFRGGNLFSTDQADCGYAVREIERIGDLWAKHSRLPILDVVYEDLVTDLDGQVRRIIDFLGVDWEPQCLDFHASERAVTTPSNWQVRQPIYSSSIGRWKRYERHLGPMLAEIGAV